jgi:hypothetical protein
MSATENPTVLISTNTYAVRHDIRYERAKNADQHNRRPVKSREVFLTLNCKNEIIARRIPAAIAVPVSPKPKFTFKKSDAVSPTVVHNILMIQNNMVIWGTLYLICELAGRFNISLFESENSLTVS